MPPNAPRTLRNLRLGTGAELARRRLNARRLAPVNVRNFFPDVPRPQAPVQYPVTPTPRVSPQSMFPGSKQPSAFNLDPKIVRLHKRQENAARAAEGQEVFAFPMNQSQGGETGGRRTRKHSRRKHSRRK